MTDRPALSTNVRQSPLTSTAHCLLTSVKAP
jgi:hypothetical protein